MRTRTLSIALWLAAASLPAVAADWRIDKFEQLRLAVEPMLKSVRDAGVPAPRVLVNWQHLDNDDRTDAIVIIKDRNAACGIAKCIGALFTARDGGFATSARFTPNARPMFIRRDRDGTHLFVAKVGADGASDVDYLEAVLPGTGKGSPGARQVSLMEAQTGATARIDAGRFTLLDEQIAALPNLVEPPMGAPVFVQGVQLPEAEARFLLTTLQRVAAARTLASSPVFEIASCGNSEKQVFSRIPVASTSDRSTIVVCAGVPKPVLDESGMGAAPLRTFIALTQFAPDVVRARNLEQLLRERPDAAAVIARLERLGPPLPVTLGHQLAALDMLETLQWGIKDALTLHGGWAHLNEVVRDSLASEKQDYQGDLNSRVLGLVCMSARVPAEKLRAALSPEDLKILTEQSASPFCQAMRQLVGLRS